MEENKTKHHRGRKTRKRKNNFLSNLILIVAILVFLFSAFQLYKIWDEYRRIDADYDALRDDVIIKDAVTMQDEVETTTFQVDFDALLALNSDVVGWIRFDEPKDISYPIARGATNDEYLRTNLEGKYSTAGTLFVDYRNSGDFKDLNTFIYGHNMRNGSMFGQLKKYIEKDFFEKYPYFYIYTPNGMETVYQIFAVHVVKDTSDAFDLHYADSQEFSEYIDLIRRTSYHTSEVAVTPDSRIITLSTCSKDDDDRLLVHAVRVSQTMTRE